MDPPPAAYSTLPELVPGEYHGGLPQRVPDERLHKAGLQKVESWDQHGEAGGVSTVPFWRGNRKIPDKKGWSRRRIWTVSLVGVAVVVVGLVVGLTVGLINRNRKSSSPAPFGTPKTFSAADTSTPSPCRGTVCAGTLSVAQLSASLMAFGRGSDRAIWYRRAGPDAWQGDWASLGGDFESQPTAVAVGDGRIDVFAVASDGGAAKTKTFQDGRWTADWQDLGGTSINALAACAGTDNGTAVVDVFGTSSSGGLARRRRRGDSWQPGLDDDWTMAGGFMSATPAAVNSGSRVDVVSYGGHAGALHDLGWKHSGGSEGDGLGGWEGNATPGSGLGYRGDPALVAVDGQTTGALGVGSDGQVYYREWTAEGASSAGYGAVRALGGSVESVPAALVSAGGRIDVLAVSTDDTLVHKARIGGTWADDWESLGGFFSGAPVPVRTDSWIAVFGLGPSGSVIHGNWSIPPDSQTTWGKGAWFDDGHQLETKWFRAGPA